VGKDGMRERKEGNTESESGGMELSIGGIRIRVKLFGVFEMKRSE